MSEQLGYEEDGSVIIGHTFKSASAVGVASVAPRPEGISIESAISSSLNYNINFGIQRELDEHRAKLMELKQKGIIDEQTVYEVLLQHYLLINRRGELLREKGKVAVMCGGELFIGDTLDEAVAKAKIKLGKRPYYSETINLIDFPSLLPIDADRISGEFTDY
jgi:hypothetical protein